MLQQTKQAGQQVGELARSFQQKINRPTYPADRIDDFERAYSLVQKLGGNPQLPTTLRRHLPSSHIGESLLS